MALPNHQGCSDPGKFYGSGSMWEIFADPDHLAHFLKPNKYKIDSFETSFSWKLKIQRISNFMKITL